LRGGEPMNIRRLFVLLVALVPALLTAQGVDQDELSSALEKTINFENFSGSHSRINTLAEIQAIGRALAAGFQRANESQKNFSGKYIVYHILGTDKETGKAADILEFTADSGVDHINNVRRIVAAYLTAAYGYSDKEAATIALFVTVYNAVHRGNIVFFKERYKASVLKVIRPDSAGIALSYREWPGKTQLFIPLASGIKEGTTAATTVSAKDLITAEVLETVRDKTDKGIEERKDIAKVIDTAVDAEQALIDQKKQDLAKQEAALKQKEADIANKTAADTKTAVDTKVTTTDSKPPTSTTTSDEVDKLAVDRKKLEDEKAALTKREAENSAASATSQELRATTAKDIADQDTAVVTQQSLALFSLAREQAGYIVSSIRRINVQTGEVVAENKELEISGRTVLNHAAGLIVIAADKGLGALVLLDSNNLKELKRGNVPVSFKGDLVLVDLKTALAVVQDKGEWYVAAFDDDLKLTLQSGLPVDPFTALRITDQSLLVQRKDGRAARLSLTDLKIIP